MTKHQILMKLFDLAERTQHIYQACPEVGREVVEVAAAVERLEANLARQADSLMADRYREHNTHSVTRVSAAAKAGAFAAMPPRRKTGRTLLDRPVRGRQDTRVVAA
jgi:hypothetical protein